MGIAGILMDRGPNIFENANGTKTLAWEPLQDMAREQLGHQRINQRVAVQSSQSAFPVAATAKRETRVPQVTTTRRCLPWEQGMHAQQIRLRSRLCSRPAERRPRPLQGAADSAQAALKEMVG